MNNLSSQGMFRLNIPQLPETPYSGGLVGGILKNTTWGGAQNFSRPEMRKPVIPPNLIIPKLTPGAAIPVPPGLIVPGKVIDTGAINAAGKGGMSKNTKTILAVAGGALVLFAIGKIFKVI